MISERSAPPTEPIRREHRELLERLDAFRATLDALAGGLTPRNRARLHEGETFLEQTLKPHAGWEEARLYPFVDSVVRAHGAPSATMIVDHRELVARIDAFRALAAGVGSANAAERERLRILGYELDAILRLHFRKEEEVYLALLDAHADPVALRALVETA